jgi:hypothetical protein
MQIDAVEQENVSLVGYHDLNDRPAFKLAMQEHRGRWYLYMAHLWHSGWSIVDVTDPTDPEFVDFIEGPADTWTLQMQVADGLMVTSLERPLEGWQPADGSGLDPEGDFEEGIYIWDVESPTEPERLGHYETGGTGTHRNFWAGGDYAYLCSAPPEFESQILDIVDLSDPTAPEAVGRWWWPGQHEDEDRQPRDELVFDVPGPIESFYFHGPAYVVGDRAYLSYGRAGVVILDVSDETDPQLISQVDFGHLGSCLGTHTVVPVHGTDYLIANSESIMEGDADSLNYTYLIDISNEEQPRVVSSMPLPRPEPGHPYENYYEKGGRFGPHNQHHYQGMDCLWNPTDHVFMTYFNAGLRIFDISDPLAPTEAGYLVPSDPTERIGALPQTLVTQSEDVLVDSRGYIYMTHKNLGLCIMEAELDD